LIHIDTAIHYWYFLISSIRHIDYRQGQQPIQIWIRSATLFPQTTERIFSTSLRAAIFFLFFSL
jgi:hypothetical protein